jgi:hypothetical protein
MHTKEDITQYNRRQKLVGKTKRRWIGTAEENPRRYSVKKIGKEKWTGKSEEAVKQKATAPTLAVTS